MGEAFVIFIIFGIVSSWALIITISRFVITNFHPVFVNIANIFEQANIYNEGKLTLGQVEYLSHLAGDSIIYHLDFYIISIVFIVFLFSIFWFISMRSFQIVFFLTFATYLFFSLLYFCNPVNKTQQKYSVILRYYPSEEFFLKALEIDKDNTEVKEQSRKFIQFVTKKDLQRFFEDQKL